MSKTIVLTGGGTAGHVTPNIALISKLQQDGWEVHYIGTKDGMENKLISPLEGVKYYSISSGKLRRYFSFKNFSDPFKVIKGIFQSSKIIKTVAPRIVFSKGGFVSVPVVIGSRIQHVPVILHESDYTPGLANKIASTFASHICVTFEETLPHIKKGKGIYTGTPIRSMLYGGSREKGLTLCEFEGKKPVILVIGGSLGALALNEIVYNALPELLKKFDIAHICGYGKVDELKNTTGYKQFEYLNEELPDVMAASELIISRAGANAIFEFLALKKPSLLIPLPISASRGDQILNARYFEKKGFAMMLEQEKADIPTFVKFVNELYENRDQYIAAMDACPHTDGTQAVLDVINSFACSKR